MKEKLGKLGKIYEGFFGERVPSDIWERRKSICEVCPYNSKNVKDLTGFDKIRNTFTNPFCTLCKCQIHEKTGSPHEDCAAYMVNEEKKWNRIKLEVMKGLNFINISDKDYGISLDLDTYVVDYGVVESNETVEVDFALENTTGTELGFTKLGLTCGCQQGSEAYLEDGKIIVHIEINTNGVSTGGAAKPITVYYTLNGVKMSQPVRIKFFKV